MAPEPVSSDEEYDPSLIAMNAQRRIFQLKKERDDHLRRIVEDCDAALAELRSRVETHYEEKHMQRAKSCAKHVKTLIDMTRRRRDIEAEMVEVVRQLHSAVQDVEELALMGYKGRQEELVSFQSGEEQE